eukprot:scaffold15228_cov118-Isochrysis_galbana.AAC.7
MAEHARSAYGEDVREQTKMANVQVAVNDMNVKRHLHTLGRGAPSTMLARHNFACAGDEP